MNAMGPVRMGMGPMHGAHCHGSHCIHILMNIWKIEIRLLYLPLFLYCLCSPFVKFWCKSCKISGKEKLLTDVFGYCIQQLSPWNDVSWTLRRPINCFNYPSLTHTIACSSVYEPRQSKIGSSKEVVGECEFYITHFLLSLVLTCHLEVQYHQREILPGRLW